MYYQLQMQAESHPNEQQFSCYVYNIPREYNHGVPKHCHSYNEIIYALESEAIIEFNGKRLELAQGDMIFFPPLVPHATISSEQPGRSFILQFSNRFLYGGESQSPGLNLLTYHPRFGNHTEQFIIHTADIPTLHNTCEELAEICAHFPDGSLPPKRQHEILGLCSEDEPADDVAVTPYYWRAKSLSLLLVATLVEQQYLSFDHSTDISPQELEQLKPLIVEMIQAPEKSMTMEQAAQMVNMSYHHFCRTFKHIFSSSFVEYKNFLRVQYAEQLLAETDKSITEIAELVNFGNLSYFNRLFKQYNGMTPTEFRSKKQNKRKFKQNQY